MNCGLTRFLRGSYTLSRRSVSPERSSPTTLFQAYFRKIALAQGKSAAQESSPLDCRLIFQPWAAQRRRSLKSQAASATRRVARAATDLLLLLSAFKKFPFLRSRASGVHPSDSACNRIRYRPASDLFLYFIPFFPICQTVCAPVFSSGGRASGGASG